MAIFAQEAEYTPEQYLALERKAACKSEYVNGRIFAMAGASRQHNQITFNISVELGIQLKERPCVAYSSDMRVKVTQTGLYAYPDIVATCNEPQFEDSFLDTLLNPTIIIEVLSESTEAYDRGGKFAHYRRLSSLEEFMLIAQDGFCVEQYSRKGKQWILGEIRGIDENIQLNSIGCTLSLRDIYHKVELSDKERFSL
ncbi:MAG: Uma2 family endonuclease [Deltaproteobacteria bacterium]|nr:Uma2 family endonuclease [Deltaproteobacteria bacterium]